MLKNLKQIIFIFKIVILVELQHRFGFKCCIALKQSIIEGMENACVKPTVKNTLH